jgi:molybdopterin converting factor small subunit
MMGEVTVEFFGMARAKANRPSLTLCAATPREAIQGVIAACPGLRDAYVEDRLSPRYLLSLDGERFLGGLDEMLPPGARLLLLSADAGG